MEPKHKIILIIRDGWGYREETEDNAIAQTPTPNTDMLMASYPNTLLATSGEAVGLPEGYQGNSEVGHMTIGGGRIMFQSLPRINKSIEEGSFFEIPEFLKAIENCKKHNTTLHLIGLLQVEGVHAHIDHLLALLDLCKKQSFKDVVVHVITDGRDAPVTASLKHLATLVNKINELGLGKIVTVSGRYYAMDRDKRWERTQKAYDCIVNGKTEREFDDPRSYIQHSHEKGETDEFIVPGKAIGYEGIKPNDSFIFYNFRTDRPRQLTQAMTEPHFSGWEEKPLDIFFVTMTQYYSSQSPKIAFKEQILTNFLGEIISKNDLKQLRISETEKYAHVTFFFNGQIEKPYENEERILIPSPKVETYDKKPEMSAFEITDQLTKAIKKDEYALIVVNLVNGDMVGHTGSLEAIQKAVATVDECVGRITKAGLENGYTTFIFADHGNAEDQSSEWGTSHTTNKVPLIIVSDDPEIQKARLREGKGLEDIAPTVLVLMGIEKPEEMTGENLLRDS
jgi:2,3-bisphosphoglycerate-independent phosphoglycerate mutase